MRHPACGLRVFCIATATILLAACEANFSATPTINGSAPHSSPSRTPKHFRVLHSFCNQYPSCSDGGNPSGSVQLDTTGAIYGNLAIGGGGAACTGKFGCGAVFKLTKTGRTYTESLLYAFCQKAKCRDGSSPAGALVFDTGGSLYGTTTVGGAHDLGTVFELMPAGSGYQERLLYSFCQLGSSCADGETPQTGVILDSSGALYGTTAAGGAHGAGTVFKLTPGPSGYTESVLYSFCRRPNCSDGQKPLAGLTIDQNGTLYGTTVFGGDRGRGVAFRLTQDHARYTEHVLYSFCRSAGCTDGANPQASLAFDRSGALYGTTYGGGVACYTIDGIENGFDGCGTVFQLTPAGKRYALRVLHRFCHESITCNDGAFPTGGVLFDTQGALYGVAMFGGFPAQEGHGGGVLFKLTTTGSRYHYAIVHKFKSNADIQPSTEPALANGTLFGTSNGAVPIRGPLNAAVWEMPIAY